MFRQNKAGRAGVFCLLLPSLVCAEGQNAATQDEAAVTLQEVTVSAAAVSDLTERREAVTQKTIIDRQAIEATGGLTVGEVLGKLPGVEGGTPGSDGTVTLRARGMGQNSVQVLVDGERPAASSRFAMTIVSRMPAGELERVEIIKGASAEFGNAAPVTINLITQRGKRKSATQVRLMGGLRDQEPIGSLHLTQEGSHGPWSWTVPISISDYRTRIERDTRRYDALATTPWQGDAERGRNTYGERYFSPKLNWKSGASSFSLWPSLFRASGERDSQMLRSDLQAAGSAPYLHRDDRETRRTAIDRLRADGETRVQDYKLSGRFSWSSWRSNNDVQRNSNGSNTARSDEHYRRHTDELNLSGRIDQVRGAHLVSLGLEYIDLDRQERNRFSSQAGSGRYDSREQQHSLWLQDEFPLATALTLSAGLRAEQIELEASNASSQQHRRHRALSPSLALRWDLAGNWQLRSSLGSALKVPKLDDISDAPLLSVGSNSPLEPDRRGNPQLNPERSVNFELGAEHYWPNDSAVAGANFYARRTRDYVERETFLEGGRWVERPYNEGRARHWGFEFDFKMKSEHFGEHLGKQRGWRGGALRGQLTLPHGKVDDERLNQRRLVRDLPRYLFSLGYEQSLPSLKASAGFQWQYSARQRSKVPQTLWASQQARSLLDLYWVQKLDRTVNLRINLQNVLGTDTRRSQRAYDSTLPGAAWSLDYQDTVPRALQVTLEGKW